MPASLGSLIVSLGLDAREYIAGLSKAEQEARRFAQATERATSTSRLTTRAPGQQAANSLREATRAAEAYGGALNSVRQIAGGLATALGIREIAAAADAWQNMQARLAIVSSSGAQTRQTMSQLFEIAQNTRQPVKEVGDLFFRLAQATEALGIDQQRIIKVTDTLNKALIASGASGTSAVSAMIQFSQGLAANRFSGQEFNSVNEQANRIIRALADGLGVTVGQLREMATEGKLTTATIIAALENQRAVVEAVNAEFAKIPVTIEGAFTRLQNEFTRFIGSTSESTGAARELVSIINQVSINLDAVAKVVLFITGLQLARWFIGLGVAAAGAAVSFAAAGTSAGLLLRTLGLLSGPVGAIIGLLAAGALAWANWSSEADKAAKKATESLEEAVDRISAAQLKQAVKQEEAARLFAERNEPPPSPATFDTRDIRLRSGVPDEFRQLEQAIANTRREIASLNGTIDDTIANIGRTGELNETLRTQENTLRTAVVRFQRNAAATEQTKFNTALDDADKILREYETDAQKLARTLKETREKLAPLGPDHPKLLAAEAAVRAKFAKKGGRDTDEQQAIKARLQGFLEESREVIRIQDDVNRHRGRLLEEQQRDDLINQEQYFNQRRALIASSLATEVTEYEKQIRELERVRPTLKEPADRERITNEIKERQRKITEAQRQAGQEGELVFNEQTRAAKEFADELDRVTIRWLEMHDRTAEAAELSFKSQNRRERARLENELKSIDTARAAAAAAALERINQMEALTNAAAKFEEIQTSIQRADQMHAIAVERIELARQIGRIGEIEALDKISALNQKRLAALREEERILANLAPTPDLQIKLEMLRLEIEKLAAATDLAKDRFDEMFSAEFGSALSDFVSGTKSAKEAFNDFTKSVLKQINDIAARTVSDWLFKNAESPLSGVGTFFARALGGRPQEALAGIAGAGKEAAAATGIATMATAATATSAPLTLLATNAGLAASALASLAAMSTARAGGGFAEDLFGALAGGWGNSGTWGMFTRQHGGLVAANQPYLVGERGPELFVPKVSGQVLANNELKRAGDRTQINNISITVPPGTSREAADQIAARVALRLQRATARNT